LRNTITKIAVFILIGILISSCALEKKVPKGKKLLTKNEIAVNNKKEKKEIIFNQLYQKPNTDILGIHLRLDLYNLAHLKHDSIYKAKFIANPEKYKRKSKWLSAKQVNRLGESFWYAGIHDFLAKTGEPPVILDKKSTDKSAVRLKSYYFNNGYFNAKTSYKIDSIGAKKAKVKYDVVTGNPFFIDSLKTSILSPLLDSLYKSKKENSIIKIGNQYKTEDFNSEISRITAHFRNNGAYLFQQNYIRFDIDTINKKEKVNVDLKINDYSYRDGDSTKTQPFKIYKISDVNIYTDYAASKAKSGKQDSTSISFNNFKLFSKGKLKYRPKAITNAVFISKGSIFSDTKTTLTSRYLSNLKVFNYPTIQYDFDPKDSTGNSLIANIYLTPKKKYNFGTSLDLTHSNIQDFGILGTATLSIRNIFHGAETFEIAARGNIGSSKDLANPNDNFFNVSEYGLDAKLNFPKIFMLFNTDKIIPKSMIPSTKLSLGYAKQRNIGLDKENFTSSLTYTWTPKKNANCRFDLINIQFVKNINVGNYFKVYGSSYTTLNTIANNYATDPSYFTGNSLIIESGTNGFLNDALASNSSLNLNEADKKAVNSINERKIRLTENNLIFASNFTFSKTTKTDINDEDFYGFKAKVESAGNFLSLLARASRQLKNQGEANTFLEVEFSQYIKSEFEFVKHWDLNSKKIFAIRSFFGIAIPYGNSNSVPFSRSYFAGGSNDNRAWQSYSLGPGRSGTINDFNEANLKIALSAEFRFNFFGKFNGALFVDAGNIWNVLDIVTDEKAVFSGFKSLKDTAIGSGMGFRYDFNFFVVRLDLGFKTYNPADETNKKWFRDYNFTHSILNIGINYPF
jgi:outer membrane protein assembly factor BamA